MVAGLSCHSNCWGPQTAGRLPGCNTSSCTGEIWTRSNDEESLTAHCYQHIYNLSQLINIHKLRSFVAAVFILFLFDCVQFPDCRRWPKELVQMDVEIPLGHLHGWLQKSFVTTQALRNVHMKTAEECLAIFSHVMADWWHRLWWSNIIQHFLLLQQSSFPSFWKFKDLICQIRQRLQTGVECGIGL